MANYISTFTGAQIDAALTLANTIPTLSANIPVTVVSPGNTTTSTSYVDLDGLSVALTAGTYFYEAEINSQSNATGGNRFAVNYTGTTTSIEGSQIGQTSTTAWGATARITALDADSTAVATTTNAETRTRLTGVIVVSTPGNFVVRGKKVTSGTTTYRAGSFLRVTRIA
jgi:hypothetical protein